MRSIRALVIIGLLSVCLSTVGCLRTWMVTFEDDADIEDWLFYPYGSDSTKSIDDNGLMLDGIGMIAPKLFTGDCTMTVVFELLSGDAMQIRDLGFFLTNYPGSQHLSFALANIGDDTTEYCAFVDNTSGYPLYSQVPGLRHIGVNTLKFKKSPGEVMITLNGEVVFSRSYSNYSEEYVVPSIQAWVESGMGYVLIKSLKVSYDGEIVDI